MPNLLRIAQAQIKCRVGDIEANVEKILHYAEQAAQQQADLVLFPELTLCGYPAQDLLLRPSMQLRIEAALNRLQAQLPKALYCVIGLPWLENTQRFNSAVVIYQGQIVHWYHKQQLPGAPVFAEPNYFSAGNSSSTFKVKGVDCALLICEDLWHPAPVKQAKAAGAEIILTLNASPFELDKQSQREQLLSALATQHQLSIYYTNLVGGQDDFIFDGQSIALNPQGQLTLRAPAFTEGLYLPEFNHQALPSQTITPLLPMLASAYQTLVLALQDYVQHNGFKGVLLGLSGGIDSAMVLAIAADALGADKVEAVMMPYHYTAQISQDDAAEQAKLMGVAYRSLAIAPMVESFLATLEPVFAGLPKDTTEENLQARCRGTLLMALSNKSGYLVLTTSNKSETAVGYSTLYGDMAGGFALLKDVPKTLVYELARYRNNLGYVIPERVIERAPSAELSPDQKDEDSLPPYPLLDEILRLYVEEDQSAQAIIQQGFAEEVVLRILRLVDLNEYKRQQAAVGPRITKRSFGADRHYPITNAWPRGN